MVSEIKKIFDSYEGRTGNLNKQHRPKLKKTLLPYLEKEYKCNNMNRSDVEDVLTKNVNENDLIKSGVQRLEEESIKNMQAAQDYVQAFNDFFRFLRDELRVVNMIIETLKLDTNTGKYARKVLYKFHEAHPNKILKDRTPNQCIKDNEYQIMIKYCRGYIDSYIVKKIVDYTEYLSLQAIVIIEVLLVYGFSGEKIWGLRRGQYDEQKGILKIEVTNVLGKVEKYNLELPKQLNKDLNKFIMEQEKVKIRKNKKGWNKDNWLFVNTEGSQLENNFLSSTLNQVEDEYKEKKFENNITPTGIMKYAIKCMIEKHIDRDIIKALTGHDDTIYIDCLNEVNRSSRSNSKYLNLVIKDVKTYAKLNPLLSKLK